MNQYPLLRTSLFVTCAMGFLSAYVGAQPAPTPPTSPTVPASAQTPDAAPAPAVPKMVPNEGVIKVGSALKQTRGRVTDVDKGDNGCYITFRDDKNNEFIEVGGFDICMQKRPLKGKHVELAYSMETIQAGDCYGDPKCKRTESVPFVTSVKIVD